MAHELTIREDGTVEAAFAETPAWHGLGYVADHAMTSEEILRAAHLDWDVAKKPLYIYADGQYMSVDNHYAVTRLDNDTVLGFVSDTYKVVPNIKAFKFMDALVEDTQIVYESAFSIRGGKKVCILARMPVIDVIANVDETKRYLLLDLGHDGMSSIHFGPCRTRVVCANTRRIALNEQSVRRLHVRHTGDIANALTAAREVLGYVMAEQEKAAQIEQTLAEQKITAENWQTFLDAVCPVLPHDDAWTERKHRTVLKARKRITDVFELERERMPEIADTAWAAFNAVTDFVDHAPRRGATVERRLETRFNTVFFGAGNQLKRKAFDEALALVA